MDRLPSGITFVSMTYSGISGSKQFIIYNWQGNMTKVQLAKASIYLAAFLSFLFSIYLWFNGQKNEGLFVGMWAPSILSLGALLFVTRSAK